MSTNAYDTIFSITFPINMDTIYCSVSCIPGILKKTFFYQNVIYIAPGGGGVIPYGTLVHIHVQKKDEKE